MKKNLLIMMMMVLCAGFVSAQTQTPTINTVRGFVPGGSTGVITGTADQPTYVVFGAPYGGIQPMDQFYEVSASIAQMQLLTDTVFAVITCQQGYYEHGFNLSWDDIEELLKEQEQECDAEGNHVYAENQMRNVAINYYYYDSLIVLNLYICPCSTKDQHANEYEVIALNNECWFKSNLRDEVIPSTLYNSEQYEVTEEMDSVFGRLYTYANVATGSCDEDNYLQGACPDGWHLITAEEAQALALIPADQLRYEQNWIVSDGSNTTGFSAQPAGVYNTSTGRYEGFFSETDYWVVKDCESLYEPVQNIVQIAYYCNTPLLIERPAGDQLSVRCVYDIVREFDKHNCIPIPDPDPTGCPRFGNMQITEDQLGFTLPIGGDYEGATVTLSYSAGIDYTVGNTEPGTTGYGVDGGETTLPIENGQVSWHYTIPTSATEDMVSLTVTVILSKGDCSDRIQKNLKTVTPPDPQPEPQPTGCAETNGEPNITINADVTSFSVTLQNVSANTTATVSYEAKDADGQPETDVDNPRQYTSFIDNTLEWVYPGEIEDLSYLVCTLTIYNAGVSCGEYVYTIINGQPEAVCPTLGDINPTEAGFQCQINNYNANYIDETVVTFKYIGGGDTWNPGDEDDFSVSETGLISATFPEDPENADRVEASVTIYYTTGAPCETTSDSKTAIVYGTDCPIIYHYVMDVDEVSFSIYDFSKVSHVYLQYTAFGNNNNVIEEAYGPNKKEITDLFEVVDEMGEYDWQYTIPNTATPGQTVVSIEGEIIVESTDGLCNPSASFNTEN